MIEPNVGSEYDEVRQLWGVSLEGYWIDFVDTISSWSWAEWLCVYHKKEQYYYVDSEDWDPQECAFDEALGMIREFEDMVFTTGEGNY